MPLDNQTGLNPAQYSIYVFGYGQADTASRPAVPAMELQSNGQFAAIAANSSGTIQSYNISTMSSITLSAATPVNSGILYFVAVPNGQAPPSLTYSTDSNDVLSITSGIPGNPPNSNPPFNIVEFTEPGDGTNYPVLDASAVNGFTFPLTVTLNNNLGQVGQNLSNPAVNRASILAAYTSFMDGQGTDGSPYQDLVFAPNSIDGQAGGIVNPNLYLANGANPSSLLNSVWNSALTTLFETTGRTVSMIGDDGDYYQGTPKQVSGQWVIHFVGYTDSTDTTPNGNVFNIYSPLTPDTSGTSYNANESAGEMVFGGDNVFNDQSANVLISTNSGSVSSADVAKGLERDINEALNRGVALLGPSGVNAGMSGGASTYWGTETNWYPAGQTENLYSLFMHTATINGTPIFTLPSGAVKDAQGTLMAQAYGFAFDENPGHGPAGQPNVPSKWEPVPAGTTTATITLGPWVQSPSPSSSSSPSSEGSPGQLVTVFLLAQDEFAYMVDGVFLRFTNDPLFTQAADRAMNLLDDMLPVDNHALFTGLSGLQSAIYANPYCGTMWGSVAANVALESAGGVFSNMDSTSS
ncbi:MAG: beta-1,3-glucanase family protein [Gemmataceae bacterium]